MILFCGDPHGIFTPVIKAVENYSPQAVILLGDLGLDRPLEQELASILEKTEVWFIPGNHDGNCDRWYDNLFRSKLRDRNLHGRVVEIDGKRIAGLGGVFREKIWRPPGEPKFRSHKDLFFNCQRTDRWRGGIPRKHHVTIFWQHYHALLHKKADILVTHEAPSCHRFGFKALDDLGQSLGVRSIFHGHHHEQYSTTICSSKIEVYGIDARAVSDEKGNVLLVDNNLSCI